MNGPEFAIFDTVSSLERVNFINDSAYGAIGSKTKLDISPVIECRHAGSDGRVAGHHLHAQLDARQMKSIILRAVSAVDPGDFEGSGQGRNLPGDVVFDVSGAALIRRREMTQHHSRRDFMRLTCCSAAGAALVGGLSKFGLVSAMAQGATDYKALVCIFLFGGNDSNNLIVPIDSRYAAYQQARANIALPQGQLLPLQSGSQANYGLHPNMPELQGFFNNQKNLAVLANVGTLVQPTTKAQYQTYKNLPSNLYSHSDQQDQWQSAQLSGAQTAGWAGKVADSIQGTYNTSAQFPPILSISGNTVSAQETPLARSR